MFWRRNGEMGEPLLNLNIINSFDVDMFCVATDIMLDGARAFVNECYFVLLCVCVCADGGEGIYFTFVVRSHCRCPSIELCVLRTA